MNIKSLLIGSAAALVAVTGARAADAVVVAEPEPVEYVRVCDAYGAGFFYIPGTETCLKISGYVRYDAQAVTILMTAPTLAPRTTKPGTSVRVQKSVSTLVRKPNSALCVRTSRAVSSSPTASMMALRCRQAFIELGGFHIGVADEIFGSWTGYAGNVLNDDVINYQSGTTNQVSYTFTGGNGFSAIIAAEQGQDDVTGLGGNYVIEDYMPHVLAGAKFEQGWGGDLRCCWL